MDIKDRIKQLSGKYAKDIIALRRNLHENPELSYKEYDTSKLIYRKLKDLKLRSVRIVTSTGVVALLEGNQKKAKVCVGLRADLDALPITEETGLPYSSKRPGIMHACGHDGHASMLYGVALILNEIKDEMNGYVKFIFQPAEEKNPGGASALTKAGVLANPKVNMIFGQHVIVNKPAGSFGFCPGVMMASQDEIYITIIGRSAHGAKPQNSIDPIIIASQVILSLQSIVSRNTDPYEPVVVTIGKIEGGTTTNIIPAEVKLSGTVRTLNEKIRKRVLKLIEKTVKGITSSAGAGYKLDISPGYPELTNDEEITRFAEKAAVEFAGRKNVFKAERFMAAEDFSYYLKQTRGTFYRIGVGNTSDIHTPKIIIDESALPVGAGFMAYLAWKYLNSGQNF